MTERDLFGRLIRSMPIGVLLQGPGAEILVSNPAALDLLGLTEDQLLGKTSFDPDWNVVHEDGSPFPGYAHPMPRAIATRGPVRDVIMGVFRPRTQDRVWLLVNAEPLLAPDGTVQEVICTFSDLSHRILERKRLDAMRDDLVQTLVHDLRSPLTSVSGALDLLGMRAHGDAVAADVVAMAHKGVARLVRLIDSILDVDRLEQGAMPFDRRAVELGGLLAELVGLAGPIGEEKGIRMDLRVDAALPRALADPELLVRVLDNLVGNALKFTPSGGTVTVEAETDAGEPAMIRLSVVDSGPGIPGDVRGRLFEKFVTGHQAGHGSGLGLAFCRLAVQAQGGRIWAESPPGGGAALRFTVPADRAD